MVTYLLKTPLRALLCFLLLLRRTAAQRLECDPCTVRSEYTVEAIVHGTASDVFWQQIRVAASQAAQDLGLNFRMKLNDEFDPVGLAEEIRNAARREPPPDVLMVSIPDENVLNAVNYAMEKGLAIVGINAGYHWAPDGVIGFVAQDDYRSGAAAVDEFLRQLAPIQAKDGNQDVTISRALFINYEKGNPTLQMRLEGFEEQLKYYNSSVHFKELLVDETDVIKRVTSINDELENCPYDVVLVAGNLLVEIVIGAIANNGCRLKTLVGTSDTNAEVFEALERGQLAFAVSQQQYLQGALPVVMASQYATSGKRMARPKGNYSVYSVGPKIINELTMPSETERACELNAFPVCPDQAELNEFFAKDCACSERGDIRIGGVLHGATDSLFWDPMYKAAEQAARDMNIDLEMERMERQPNNDILHRKMVEKIEAMCDSGFDGIFVSIPSDIVIEGIQFCLNRSVPVVSVNIGADVSQEMGLMNHVGQEEYKAGYEAGQRLLAAGMRTGYCMNHNVGNKISSERCRGFQSAIEEVHWAEVHYGGIVNVSTDFGVEVYATAAENAIGDVEGEWSGVGILLLGSNHLESALYLQTRHRRMIIGQFDLSSSTYEPLEDGRLLFAVDQQPHLQGSWPVYLLTYKAYTDQAILNPIIETGPKFIEASANLAQEICDSTYFQVCDFAEAEEMNYISTPLLATGYALFALIALLSLACFGWIIYYRGTSAIINASQPYFLALIVLGCFIANLTLLPLSIETTYRESKSTRPGSMAIIKNPDIERVDVACSAGQWLYCIGFVMTFSVLLAKVMTWKQIADAGGAAPLNPKLCLKSAAWIFGTIMSVEVIVLITWQIISPQRWERTVTVVSSDGLVLESEGRCTSDHGWYFLVGLLMFHLVCLFYALLLCFEIRNSITPFSEIKWATLSLMCLFQVSILFMPIGAMVYDDIDGFYFLRVFAIFLQNLSVLSLMFGPKVWKILKKEDTLPATTQENTRLPPPRRPRPRTSGDSLRITVNHDDLEHFPREANPANNRVAIEHVRCDSNMSVPHVCPHCARILNEADSAGGTHADRRGVAALNSEPRDMDGDIKREPHQQTGMEPHQLSTGSQEPHQLQSNILEPHQQQGGQEPHLMRSREPHQLQVSREPHVQDKNLEPHQQASQEPHLKSVEPHQQLASQEPHLMSVEPHLSSVEPHHNMKSEEPRSKSREPHDGPSSQDSHQVGNSATDLDADIAFQKIEAVYDDLEHFGEGRRDREGGETSDGSEQVLEDSLNGSNYDNVDEDCHGQEMDDREEDTERLNDEDNRSETKEDSEREEDAEEEDEEEIDNVGKKEDQEDVSSSRSRKNRIDSSKDADTDSTAEPESSSQSDSKEMKYRVGEAENKPVVFDEGPSRS